MNKYSGRLIFIGDEKPVELNYTNVHGESPEDAAWKIFLMHDDLRPREALLGDACMVWSDQSPNKFYFIYERFSAKRVEELVFNKWRQISKDNPYIHVDLEEAKIEEMKRILVCPRS